MRRIDPEDLTEAFAKDQSEEDFLEQLNLALAPRAEADYREELAEAYPTLHVIGVPRSGTTLLYQVVASGLEIGFVNHLVAAFWLAPVYGLRLSRKLGLDRRTSSFESAFGRTPDVGEPHEFGYFWNHHLRYPDLCEQPPGHDGSIDWPHLRKVLVNLAHANQGPMAFKPMLLTWHLETMLEHMPRTCYVWIRRDLRETALSLLAHAPIAPRLGGRVDVAAAARAGLARRGAALASGRGPGRRPRASHRGGRRPDGARARARAPLRDPLRSPR